MSVVLPSLAVSYPNKVPGERKNWRYIDLSLNFSSNKGRTFGRVARKCAFTGSMSKKTVWIWTENKQVMTAAVERGWNTFIFSSHRQHLALEWSSTALINPLFIEEGRLIDHEHRRVAAFAEISSPKQLEQFQISEEQADKFVVDLLDWQVIPAENIVAAFQATQKNVLAGSKTQSEAQNAETVGLVSPLHGEGHQRTAIPMTSIKVGDEVLLLLQGGARHTGIEIKEFIVEK